MSAIRSLERTVRRSTTLDTGGLMSDKTVRDAVLDTVLNQIDTGDPPEARQTYDRLVDGGASNSQALHLMAQVLRVEMNEMLTKSTPFDNARYASGLAKLKSPES
jgi:hypothetical protein